MSRNYFRRSLFVFALLLGISAAPAAAFPREILRDVGSLWTRLADVLEAALPWSKAGCSMDPDGKPVCQPESSTAKLGCSIDPNGKPVCQPESSTAKHGCSIDPDGKPVCQPLSTNKAGCSIDPNGKPACLP